MLSIAKHCPHLTTLDVSHCSVTDFSLFEIAERSTNLTYLGYSSHSALTPPLSLLTRPLSPPPYVSLISSPTYRLNKCQQVTNEAIIRVTQHCTKLEGKYISLSSCFLPLFLFYSFLFFFHSFFYSFLLTRTILYSHV